ncbi:unnamed protein product [Closterium sp. NIES-54]
MVADYLTKKLGKQKFEYCMLLTGQSHRSLRRDFVIARRVRTQRGVVSRRSGESRARVALRPPCAWVSAAGARAPSCSACGEATRRLRAAGRDTSVRGGRRWREGHGVVGSDPVGGRGAGADRVAPWARMVGSDAFSGCTAHSVAACCTPSYHPPTISPRPQPLLAATTPCPHRRFSPSAMASPADHSAPPQPHSAQPSDAAEPRDATKAALEGRNERSMAEVAALRREEVGVVVVDHGSRRAESNQQLDVFVGVFQQETGYSIVEPAHMEIAEPSIAVAFMRCVQRGARGVIVCPYFLSPGRHWQRDIPALAAEAAAQHSNGVPFIVTAPIGVHPLVARVLEQRITHCLERVASGDATSACDACRDGGGCMEQILL